MWPHCNGAVGRAACRQQSVALSAARSSWLAGHRACLQSQLQCFPSNRIATSGALHWRPAKCLGHIVNPQHPYGLGQSLPVRSFSQQPEQRQQQRQELPQQKQEQQKEQQHQEASTPPQPEIGKQPAEGSQQEGDSASLYLRQLAGLAGGIGFFLVFDAGVRTAMHETGLSAYLPTQIGGMLLSFSTLSAISLVHRQAAELIHATLMPSVGFVNRWLPVFLAPVQVMLPTIRLPGGTSELVALLAFLTGSWMFSLAVGARFTVLACKAFAGGGAIASAAAAAARPAGQMSALVPSAWLSIAAVAFGAGVLLPPAECNDKEAAAETATSAAAAADWQGKLARGLCLACLGAAGLAIGMFRNQPGHIGFLYCGGLTMAGAGMLATARGESFETVVRRDYIAADGRGAGDYLLWFLGPALVATGVQIFQYRQRIQQYGTILLAACAVSSLANILSTVVAAPMMGISTPTTLAATVRCVTVPMGVPCYEQLCHAQDIDFNIGLLALCAGVSGFLGFIGGMRLLTLMGHTTDQAITRGIAIGSSSHVLGSVSLAGAETEAFAWGMLATAVSGVCSAFWLCGFPPTMRLTVQLADRGSDAQLPASS